MRSIHTNYFRTVRDRCNRYSAVTRALCIQKDGTEIKVAIEQNKVIYNLTFAENVFAHVLLANTLIEKYARISSGAI